MALKKNEYMAWGQLSVDVLEKVEELRDKRNVKNVYDVWKVTKPEGLDEGRMYVPQDLTQKLYGMLKVWSKYVYDLGYDPMEVLKYLIKQWVFIKSEMYWLGQYPNVPQLLKYRAEMLNYYLKNKKTRSIDDIRAAAASVAAKKETVEPPVTNPQNAVNATNCTHEEKQIVKKKGNITIKRGNPPPDANCITAPDGSCVSTEPCMHSPGYFDEIRQNVPPVCMVEDMNTLHIWHEEEAKKIQKGLDKVDELRGTETLKEIQASKEYAKVVQGYAAKVAQLFKLKKEKLSHPENAVKMPTASPLPIEGEFGSVDLGEVPDYEDEQ